MNRKKQKIVFKYHKTTLNLSFILVLSRPWTGRNSRSSSNLKRRPFIFHLFLYFPSHEHCTGINSRSSSNFKRRPNIFFNPLILCSATLGWRSASIGLEGWTSREPSSWTRRLTTTMSASSSAIRWDNKLTAELCTLPSGIHYASWSN